MTEFIIGGQSSGKSEYAEKTVLSISDEGNRYYIATMIAYGEEGKYRVNRHQKLREGKGFITIEQPVKIDEALLKIDEPEKKTIIID